MRARMVPRGARTLRTYAEFESYLVDFVERRYPFVWIVGRPGISKSESIQAAVRGREVYYRKSGQLTPLQFYLDCFRHRNRPIILDDAEHLLEQRLGAKLVSALGETAPVKSLSYGTTSRALGEVPEQYMTTSSLCILANKCTTHEAIQSRAVILHFDPTNAEVHQAAARWFWDQEIHDWFGRHVNRLEPIDARWYFVADRDKRARRDWRTILLEAHSPDRATCLVQDLETDQAYPSRKAKAARFSDLMGDADGGSRASYFRLRKRLEQEGRLCVQGVEPIRLRRTKPPGVPSEVELEAMTPATTAVPPPVARPIDVPLRDAFSQPIQGTHQAPAPYRPVLDDRVGWERTEEPEDDDEAGEEQPGPGPIP